MKQSYLPQALFLGVGTHVYLLLLLLVIQAVADVWRFELTPHLGLWLSASALALSLLSYGCLHWLERSWRRTS